jgi:phospho-N-acetylmuramoyl-pentapeptide-transferase
MIIFFLNLFGETGDVWKCTIAAATSFLFCLFFGPFFIRKLYELKIGQPIRQMQGFLLGELHRNKKDTPTMGGILIVASMIVSCLLWMDLSSPSTWILLFSTLVFALLGGIDDYLKLRYKSSKGLSASKKMAVQLFAAAGVIVCQRLFLPSFRNDLLYCPFIQEPLFYFSGISLVLLWAFLAFVIVGASNAVNLTDGLDGLASGLCLFALFALAVCGLYQGYSEVAIFLAGGCGACLGFLWYNCHPAQVFMGDIGSLTLGGVMGVSAVLLKQELFLGIVGGIFVLEALSVILQVASFKFRNKKRIFLCAPLHHHFEYKGWPETKVVVRFWIIGLLLMCVGLSSLFFG